MTGATSPGPRRRLGDFEIIREIGRGGMGVVHEARQVSLNRKVALKVLSGGLGLTPTAVARFRREAEAAAKLHHTNIVPIYATGQEHGTHFYAMELIEGPSLNVVIRQIRCDKRQEESRLPATPETQSGTTPAVPGWVAETLTAGGAEPHPGLSEAGGGEGSTTLTTGGGYFDNAARMIAEIADALDYAHNQGVVHRDIKPSNLLLSPGGRLSINDFGLARMLEQPGMTMTGEFMGSPLYMSPEQITAGRAPLDHRTDIYSLGATLYELLTLQPPFPGERRDQIIAQIISKEPKSPRRVNKKVPIDLETICLKALEKDPDRRYQTAGQMADDLRKYVNRYAISAKRAGPVARAVKWVRRRPAVAALLGVVVALGVFAGVLAYTAHRSSVRMVEVQRQRAIDNALLAAMSGDLAAAGTAVKQAELLGASAGWIRMLQGQVALHGNHPQEALEHLQQAVRLMPNSAGARALLALAHEAAGDYQAYYQTLADLDGLAPVTAEDYLFKGQAVVSTGMARSLEMLDEAIRRRDSVIARLARGESRYMQAITTHNPEDAELALEDLAVARSMLPDNPVALCWHLLGHLVAAKIFDENQDHLRRDASLAQAQRDARALAQFDGLCLAHWVRARYFDHLGNEEAALAEWRRAAECPNAPYKVVGLYAVGLYRRGSFADALRVLDRLAGSRKDTIANSRWFFILAELPDGPTRALTAARNAARRDTEGMFALDSQQALRLLGHKSEAIESCRSARDRSLRGIPPCILEWKRQYVDYQCGTISAQQLLDAAKSSGWRQCEAHFMIGLDCLAEGDRVGAAKHFQESLDTYAFGYYEYTWSRAFLTRLQQDPTWPPWIPLKEGTQARGEEGTKDQPGLDRTIGGAAQPASAPVDEEP